VLALNGLAVPIGTVLYLMSHTLPLDGLIANSVWALINGALALAVISFTAISQRNARTRYRFPISLPAEVVVADGTRLRGTVDDLSDHGMRFYGKLPATLAAGDALTGHLLLPEGPVPFWGQVRGRITLPGDAHIVKAIGCEFATSDEGRQRLEQFLFGSDLQWILNGYTDRVHTPLSHWLKASIDGPLHNPLASVRWNAAEVRVERDGPAEPVLLSAVDGASAETYLVSHHALPERRELVLDVHLRSDAPARSVQLERVALTGPGGGETRVCVYRISASRIATETPVAAPAPSTIETAPTRPAALGFEALPSTY
jgi:cellulose synthase (UDP-forming)